jgi:hypothetical protein
MIILTRWLVGVELYTSFGKRCGLFDGGFQVEQFQAVVEGIEASQHAPGQPAFRLLGTRLPEGLKRTEKCLR